MAASCRDDARQTLPAALRKDVISPRELLTSGDETWVCQEWVCTICGAMNITPRGKAHNIRDAFACPTCGVGMRYRNQAAAILDAFARGYVWSLRGAVEAGLFNNVAIYEAALYGPFRRRFSGLKNYTRSYFWENMALGTTHDGVRCEDLTRLTFDSEMFDLVITSDVFEHVFEPEAAFREIYRVLKPGGVHIFSLPTAWPFPQKSVERARMNGDTIEHLQPPRYHRAGDGSDSLVVTDWGNDLLDLLETIGFKTQAARRALPLLLCFLDVTFISRKGW
jgi:SAM-dependent methyltransferase